jgi:multiple sugar transport system ATP-binding protein
MASISCSGLRKVYGDGTVAVDGLDLHIDDGEFMVLVGPSGCGKSTLLRMIAGLEPVTDGTISFGDTVMNDVMARDRDIGMVFQSYALYPHMNVYDNIGFGLKLRRVPKREMDVAVRVAARKLALEGVLEKKPKHLSGGQRQRVAMGRAIARTPQVFLMDEPLANLDAKLRVDMRTEISQLQRSLGTTTVYVTHDQTEAMTLGHRAAVMNQGRLLQVDAPQTLYNRPRNLFVAAFIGSPAMNLVEADLEEAGDLYFAAFAGERVRIGSRGDLRGGELKEYDGRTVILGIRPEHMEDVALVADAPIDARISATVELREEMGSEAYVYFGLDARPVITEDTQVIAADLDAAALEKLERRADENRTRFVARLNPDSRARHGERLELVVNVDRLHFFDPDSGMRLDRMVDDASPSHPDRADEPRAVVAGELRADDE